MIALIVLAAISLTLNVALLSALLFSLARIRPARRLRCAPRVLRGYGAKPAVALTRAALDGLLAAGA